MDSIYTIDADYLFPEFAACYVFRRGGEGLVVDVNSAQAANRILETLSEIKLSPESISYLIVTHVHLDHSSGAGSLLKHLPKAKVICHPRAVKHLVDPTRLLESARAVYGAEKVKELYGEISPISEDRILPVEDGQVIAWRHRKLRFLHTPGHAKHHICILDENTQSVFTGDAFGLRYPSLSRDRDVIFPSTSPIDFDPIAAKESVERIAALKPITIYPTHFGAINQIQPAKMQLLSELAFYSDLLKDSWSSGKVLATQKSLMEQIELHLRQRFQHLSDHDWQSAHSFLKLDIELNAAGILASAQKLAQ